MQEFDTKFDKLYDQISIELYPPPTVVCVLYMNSFEGQLGFILKDKASDTLGRAKEYSAQIEENLISSKIEPFQFPRAKV
jgi:hypothetical protein